MKSPGWELRLQAYFDDKKNKPFKRGFHDCAMFAADAVNIIRDNDQDIAKVFRVNYKSKRQADMLLHTLGYKNLEYVAESLIKESKSVMHASRGDLVSVGCPEGVALAIVDLSGKRALTTGKKSLVPYPLSQWRRCWEV